MTEYLGAEMPTDPMMRKALAGQRRILVSGPLDHEAINDLAAQLMAFDGASSNDVELVITSPGGPLDEVFAVLDVLNLMRAKVHVTVIGSASGTAVAVVAVCSGERRAASHASFSLRLDDAQPLIGGTAGDLARHADELSRFHTRYLEIVSAATGMNETSLAVEIDRGGTHSADEALALGLVDVIRAR